MFPFSHGHDVRGGLLTDYLNKIQNLITQEPKYSDAIENHLSYKTQQISPQTRKDNQHMRTRWNRCWNYMTRILKQTSRKCFNKFEIIEKNRKSQQWSKKTTERGKKIRRYKKEPYRNFRIEDKITKILKLMGLIA